MLIKIADYISYLKHELNLSLNTISSYKIDLMDFNKYLLKHKISFLQINREQVHDYLRYLTNKKLTNATISRKISCLRSFYNFMVYKNVIEHNIFKEIKNPKIHRRLPNYLNYEEMRKILDSIDITNDEGILDKLIIELLYATGVRVSELCNIKTMDLDLKSKTIRIMGKGSKERLVFYGDYAQDILNLYLKKIYSKRKRNSDYLLLNSQNLKFTIFDIEKRIKKIVKNLALKNNVTPHTFRHTFATHLLNNGADIKTVQELLGHANLNTTAIYTHLSNEKLREVYLKTFPR